MTGAGRDKREWRRELLAARSRRPERERAEAGRLLALRGRELPELAGAATVAAYVSVGGEPPTGPLLDALWTDGVRVLLPVLRGDDDLDWAPYEGPDRLAPSQLPGRMRLWEPVGPRLGVAAVTGAEVVLLPGLAVDGAGHRLGRGGGSYDRVLARLDAAGVDPALVVLLYDEELLPVVPHEPHDRLVRAVLTPSGVRRLEG